MYYFDSREIEVSDIKKTQEKRTPPKKRSESIQMNMFSNFVTNDGTEVSNTIELWESIPKYFLSNVQMEKLRTADGLANPYKWEYISTDTKGAELARTVKIQPALIEQKDGSYKAFFPSATEELVEEALKKIFTEQSLGLHEVQKVESWVRFSLRMIYRELKNRGKTRDLTQIKHAIEVMSSCVITVEQDGKIIYRGNILSDLIAVDRDVYENDPSSHWIARLPVFVSHAINRLQYRQFNYGRFMECHEQLSRWLYKRLITRFRQASIVTDYHFMYSDLAQNSGLLQMSSTQGNRRKVLSALDELAERGVIFNDYVVDNRKKGRKIVDIKYIVRATPEFIREQKAANKRYSDDQKKALQAGIKLAE